MAKKKKIEKPSDKQIQAELGTLKAYRGLVRRYSMFGEDNRAAVDAQIQVVEDSLSEDEVYERWEDEDYLRDNALEMVQWLLGQGEPTSPSENWKPLVNG